MTLIEQYIRTIYDIQVDAEARGYLDADEFYVWKSFMDKLAKEGYDMDSIKATTIWSRLCQGERR